MKKVVALIVALLLTYGQNFTSTKKLVMFSKENEIITDALIINNEMFFSLEQVNTPVVPAPQSAYIVKLDTALNLITKVDVNKNNLTITPVITTIYKVLQLKHPVTQEPVIGFIGGMFYINNNSDSIRSLIIGYAKTNFSEIKTYYNLFSLNVSYDTTGNPQYYLPQLIDAIDVNDSTLLILLKMKYNNSNYLYRIKFDSLGFHLIDSVQADFSGMFKLNQKVYCYKVINGTSNYELKISEVILQPTLSLGTIKTFSNLPANLQAFTPSIGKPIINYNDTLFMTMTIKNLSTGKFDIYLYKLVYDPASVLKIQDSLLVYSDNSRFSIYYGNKTISLRYPYCYLYDDNNPDMLYYPGMWDYEWIHFSYQPNSLLCFVLNTNNLTKLQQIALGGDALYKINGIITPYDSVLILFGWYFPIGDSTRHDGDALVLKIVINDSLTVKALTGKTPDLLILYNNPVENALNLKINGFDKYKISIYDISSKLIYEKFHSEKQVKINTENLKSGLYFLIIKDDKKTRILKFIKN